MTESRACIRTHPDTLEDSSIVRRDQNLVHVVWRQVNLGPERDLDAGSDGFYSAMSDPGTARTLAVSIVQTY